MYSHAETKNQTFTDFQLLFCGIQESLSLSSFGPAISDCFSLHYCIKGKGYYHVCDHTYEINKGDGFLIMPNEITFYQADKEDPWTYIWIGVSGSKCDIYLQHCGLNRQRLVTHCDEIEFLTALAQEIIIHNKLSYRYEMFIQGKLFEFFSYFTLDTAVDGMDHSSDNIYINKTIEYMQHNYQHHIRVQEIADYIGLHRSYLSTIFTKQLHMSPQHFLMKYRITKAMNLLIETELSINTISFSCGYVNQLAFSKAFHKIAHKSPSNYRRENQPIDHLLYNIDAHSYDV